jgi:hypothetical protein
MERILRGASLATGVVFAVLAIGFAARMPWATRFWPFAMQESRLGFLFLSSIVAAIAAPVLWIGFTGELRAAVGGAINLCLTAVGWVVFATRLGLSGGRADLVRWAAAVAIIGAFTAALLVLSRRFPWRDARPMPRAVRWSFVLFAAVLIPVAAALIAAVPAVFPWPLARESSVMYGWIFLGAATYFIYGALRPLWANAAGQLLGFLAYDAVLIVPFLRHFATVRPAHRMSLTIYVTVLCYSATLAVFYLVAMRGHRTGGPRAVV